MTTPTRVTHEDGTVRVLDCVDLLMVTAVLTCATHGSMEGMYTQERDGLTFLFLDQSCADHLAIADADTEFSDWLDIAVGSVVCEVQELAGEGWAGECELGTELEVIIRAQALGEMAKLARTGPLVALSGRPAEVVAQRVPSADMVTLFF